MEDPNKVLTAKEQLTQELNSQQWLKKQALKNQDKIRGAALDTRVDVLEQKATEFADLEAQYKLDERRHKYALSLDAKRKPQVEEIHDDDDEENLKKSSQVHAPEFEYFAADVKMPDFERQLAEFATKNGLKLTELELRVLTKELGKDARAIQSFISDVYGGLKEVPKLGMAIVNGKLSLVLDCTKEQMNEICEALGFKFKETSKKDKVENAVEFTPAVNAANPAPPVSNAALNTPGANAATPRPNPPGSNSKANADEEKEHEKSSYKSPTPFKTTPRPYPTS